MKKPETVFREKEVIPFLKTLKNTAYFPIQQRAISGDADFYLCVFGRFVALELKSTHGKLSKLQEFKRTWIESKHGIWLTADPRNWQHVRNRLSLLADGLG